MSEYCQGCGTPLSSALATTCDRCAPIPELQRQNARLRADLAALVPLARFALQFLTPGSEAMVAMSNDQLDAARRVLAAYEKEGT